MGRIDDYLETARAGLNRVTANDLPAAMEAGAVVVDIRPVAQRERDGDLPGAHVIDRNVLEWRLAPSSASRVFDLDDDSHVIIVCNQGYQSSVAAAALQDLGLRNATDLIGGYQAWIGGDVDPGG